MKYSLTELAEKIGASIVTINDTAPELVNIHSLATLANAGDGQIAFLSNKKYQEQLASTKATVVIVNPDLASSAPCHALVMDNPYLGYALVAQLLDTTPKTANGIHKTAVIDSSVILGENVSVGANAVIERNAVIADNASIGAGCFIGENARIGANTKLWANVSVYHNVVIGTDCLIQANTVIGSDGFGYANTNGQWLKIPQLGSVIIGNRVEIGASTTIDRGALDNTEIHDGVILDNQIQIAHNVIIGENSAIAACSVIAGSTTMGKNCSVAGLVGINGHIDITDNCLFTGMTMVTKSITEAGVYSSGMPATDNKEWRKTNARIKKLDSIIKRVNALEKQ